MLLHSLTGSVLPEQQQCHWAETAAAEMAAVGRVLCIGGWPAQLLPHPAQRLGPALAWGHCRVRMLLRWQVQTPQRARGRAVELAPWLGLMCCWERWWMLSQ